MRFAWGAIAVLLFLPVASAQCFEIDFPSQLELEEGVPFSRDVSIPNATYTVVNNNMPGFAMERGIISFTPGEEDVGENLVFLLGFNSECHDSVLTRFTVRDRPAIVASPENIDAEEGRGINFRIRIIDSDDDEHAIRWLLDSVSVANATNYTYVPGFNDSGRHTVEVMATDSAGLSDSHSWEFIVGNVNRHPVMVEDLPGLMMQINASSLWLDLDGYFKDPDLDNLRYSYMPVEVEYETSLRTTDITLEIDGSIVTAYSSPMPGYMFFRFTATDPSGKEAESNNVRIEARRTMSYTPVQFCGDEVCSGAETCNSCARDCGPCGLACVPEWECTEWEACQPSGLQARTCIDVNECGTALEKPAEAGECVYVPTCEDGLQNGNETGIDCGGSCPACPTCYDGIQNQGEERADCGGPCDSCPTCSDNIRNQNETDVDCGGVCGMCGPGKECRYNDDCTSLSCIEGFCQPATCEDGIRNQNEEKMDCGGPCPACPTCYDGIQNQGEERADCGGANCEACATCNDGIRNQGERLSDCGGPCGRCMVEDYLGYLEFKGHFLFIIVLSIIFIVVLKVFLGSDTYYDMSHGGFLTFLERDRHLGKVIVWDRLRRHLRFRKGLRDSGSTKDALSGLRNASEKEEMVSILLGYFRSILPVPKDPDYEDVYRAIKTSGNAFLVKILLVHLLRKAWYLKMETMVLEGDAARIRRNAITIMKELERDA